MDDLFKICYKAGGNSIAYKKGGHAPIYKVNSGAWTTVTFAWDSSGKDLDICAYWDGASSMKVGYGYLSSNEDHISGAYHIDYSGDITGIDSSEWVKIKMAPWSVGERSFKVHLNYFGYDADTYTSNKCSVVATQSSGPTKVLFNVSCSTRRGEQAIITDPGVKLTFNPSGILQSLEEII